MVVSISGMRAIFDARGDSEGRAKKPAAEHGYLVGMLAHLFALFMQPRYDRDALCRYMLVARDSRPSGAMLARYVAHGLNLASRPYRYLGVMATPELLAYSASDTMPAPCAFIMITASHNPIGYNGLKVGFAGHVLSPADSSAFIAYCNRHITDHAWVASHYDAIRAPLPHARIIRQHISDAHRAYRGLIARALAPAHSEPSWDSYIHSLLPIPRALFVDYNGCARTRSIDRSFYREMGITVHRYASRCGDIRHQIEPEGAALHPLCRLVQKYGARHAHTIACGILYDNDGDRGNLVRYSTQTGEAVAIAPQELFALLTLIALLAHRSRANRPPTRPDTRTDTRPDTRYPSRVHHC